MYIVWLVTFKLYVTVPTVEYFYTTTVYLILWGCFEPYFISHSHTFFGITFRFADKTFFVFINQCK